jgi:autotransporter translocation and assembly factor TamB
MPLKEILRQQGKLDPQSPLQLSVRVPRGPLSVLTRIVPAIRFIQGTAEASVDVAGTVARPQLSGAALLDLPAVRLANPDMPSLNGFRGEVRFAGNRLTLGQFGGNLSGGRFDLTGGIVFADFTNPVIDLHFVSHGDLILRNEAVTVRADSDVRISGPLAGASVAGDIGITKSRFFKQIDILPLDLPGRPAPPPPPAPATSPSIDVPPLSNWKFALKIHTKDPFIIQGNLANGAALIDLNLGGTGKAPTLDGTVRIENFVASLPFSKLRVTNGFVYFTKDDPFIPHLNIQAASTLQDYEVNVYIYGTAQDPKTVMSSEPPLRQQDIVSLLATGATTSSLNSGTGLAGRAAVLLAQSIYHKIFKAKPPTDNESFASRFKVDVGGVDPRTGQQEISSSFKLSGDLYLIGDIDVGGDLRGMVRYLLRFR